MKKISFSLLFAILSFSAANAQVSSGTLFLGGGLGFNSHTNEDRVGSTTTEDWKTSNVNVNLNAGYFIADNWAIGLNLGFNRNRMINYTVVAGVTTTTTTTSSPLSIGVFARRYFMTGENFGLFAGLGVNVLTGPAKMETETPGMPTTTLKGKVGGFNTNLHGGLIWFPTSSVGLEAQLGILSMDSRSTTWENTPNETEETDTDFNFDLSSMNLSIGFHYYFLRD